jgi:hypothetical protein
MNKCLLSQQLDGAAFPVIMLAVAVSQIKIGANQKDAGRNGGGVATELQMGDRVQQNPGEYWFYTPTWRPPVAEKPEPNGGPAQGK